MLNDLTLAYASTVQINVEDIVMYARVVLIKGQFVKAIED